MYALSRLRERVSPSESEEKGESREKEEVSSQHAQKGGRRKDCAKQTALFQSKKPWREAFCCCNPGQALNLRIAQCTESPAHQSVIVDSPSI